MSRQNGRTAGVVAAVLESVSSGGCVPTQADPSRGHLPPPKQGDAYEGTGKNGTFLGICCLSKKAEIEAVGSCVPDARHKAFRRLEGRH